MGLTKNSSWQVKQSILCTTVNFRGDCTNVCEGRLELWRQRNWLLHQRTVSHFISYQQLFFTKNNTTVSLTHPTFLCFPNWRWNWNTAILAQLRWSWQNCTTSWMHFKNGRRARNGAYARKGTTSKVIVARMIVSGSKIQVVNVSSRITFQWIGLIFAWEPKHLCDDYNPNVKRYYVCICLT
jgi:hypothetical protein